MKKKFLFILMFNLFMVVGFWNVKAESYSFETMGPNCNVSGSKYICTFGIKANTDFNLKNVTIRFINMRNVYFNEGNKITEGSGWQSVSVDYSNNKVLLKRTGGSFIANTEYPIITVEFDLDNSVAYENCHVAFEVDPEEKIICGYKYENENYKWYDKDGNEVSKSEYLVSCFNIPACRSVDLVVNGEKVTIYFGKDRTEVTKEQYEQECFTDVPICSIKNGIYYGINGSEISKEEYIKQCEFPCTKLEDGTFIGKDNTIVSETDYNTQCKYHCEYAYGKYYDKDGNETTKLNYEKTCFKNVCKKLSDGTYYNSKGEETDELTYQKECEKNVCKVLSDGTYYDNNGKVVTKEEYEKVCNTCKEENGKYYDKEGKETTKENFELVCKVHKCQVINNTYFDDKGNIVTKEVYDKYCTNPKTGNIVPYIYTFLGILTATGLFVYSKKHKKLNRI